jgi:TonB family protein
MNETAIRNDWVGQVIDGKFTLLQWLGGSELGDVFLTELPGDRRQKAAIKLIPADGGAAEAQIAGMALAATLSHRHLMRLFHTGRCQIDTSPLLYSVTEYADEVLSQILPERPLTIPEAREMLDAVLDALSYLHGKGLVHGRLKPSNVMAVGDQLKLSADSVHRAGEPGKQTPASSVYDAPERATGTISPASDLWSLGVTLVEVLTQHPPVWDRSTAGEPVVPESIPQPYAGIARECLRPDPARRCTLSEIKAMLEPARPLPVVGSKPSPSPPAKPSRAPLVAAVLVLLAIFAALLFRSHQPVPSQPAGQQQNGPAVASHPAQSLVSDSQTPPAPETQEPKAPESQSPPTAETQAPATAETQASAGAAVTSAVAQRVLPDVPPKASATIHGSVKVRVRVAVDPGGNVSSATLDSPAASKYFANLALEAARQWRFKPTQVDGQAVPIAWILQFEFRQTGTEVTPVEASH